MSGERDLPTLLHALRPELQPGTCVFTTTTTVRAGAAPVVTVREDEGLTLVLDRQQADDLGLPYNYVAAWITPRVNSALDAVDLTAAVAGALAAEGISCNVVAGYHHDHLFVPAHQAHAALDALNDLTAQSA